MPWNAPHQRAAGLAVQVLRPVGVYAILTNLTEFPHLHPAEMTRLLLAADAADAPMTGARGFDLYGVSHRLAVLRACGLVDRCDRHQEPGHHASYEITRLGAGLIGSLSAVTDWGLDNYDLAIAAARARAGMAGGLPAVDPVLRRPRPATGMTLGLLDVRWSYALLMQVGLARQRGVDLAAARVAINTMLAGVPETVRYELHRAAAHRVLRYLEDVGLVARLSASRFGRPARVLYYPTEAGSGLMKALWPVAEWGIGHDGELSAAVALTSSWFATRPV